MRLLAARGKIFRQGSEDPLAAPDEKPAMTTGFTYDFQMDTLEVTQGAFKALLGRNPSATGSGFGDGYPVTKVTWYDAVLYCNARSKAEGLDTVYEYAALQAGSDGSVYGMTRVAIRLEREGYRLPTESEWEFAAKAGSEDVFPWGALGDSGKAGTYAWFAGNAGGAPHPAGSLKPNAFGLHDMAGNVMEWVNDWKAPYPAVETRDFAGAANPGSESAVPVKGGAYVFGLREMRPANRADAYPALRSTASAYLGFRCAFGPVKAAEYASEGGGVSGSDPVTLTVTRMQTYVGGHGARLVFVNASRHRRRLTAVDYRAAPPRVREFTDADDVFHPAISPDGKWVAWCTRLEGADTGSILRVRALDGDPAPAPVEIGPGFIPRWWIDPATQDTFLVYSSSAVDDIDPRWPSTATWRRKMRGGSPEGAPLRIAAGGYHDGLSADGRYLATGYRRLRLRDLSAGTERILFTAPDDGKQAGDTSQVCNVSMAPDSTGRTLFLDFGSPTASALVGSAYGLHEIGFVSDTVGKVKRWYRTPVPGGWEDLEWSNHPDFAVSALKDPSGAQQDLWLLNLRDSVFTPIASSAALEQPALWVDAARLPPVDGLDLDSLGHYNEPIAGLSQESFSDKMSRFWHVHDGIELLIIGSSHAAWGVDPHGFSLSAFNMSYIQAGWKGMSNLTLHYALPHCPKLKVVVMETHLGLMNLPGADWHWEEWMSKTKGFQYDRSHGFWEKGLPPQMGALVDLASNVHLGYIDSMGTVFLPGRDWGPVPPIMIPLQTWKVDDANYVKNLAELEDLAKTLAARQVKLVLVNFPQSPAFKDAPLYQRYGPSWETARTVIADLRALEKANANVTFYDANDFGNHDYAPAEAYDGDHLGQPGAKKLTARLDSLISVR